MSEIKHSPLPFHACQYEIGTIYSAKRLLVAKNVIFGRTIGLNDVEFIVEACNNYYKLKEQNEKLKEALEKIQNPVLYLQKQAEASGAKMDGLMAVALSKDCEWLKNIAYETLKSCEDSQA